MGDQEKERDFGNFGSTFPSSRIGTSALAGLTTDHDEDANKRLGTSLSHRESRSKSAGHCPSSKDRSTLTTEHEQVEESSGPSFNHAEMCSNADRYCPSSQERRC